MSRELETTQRARTDLHPDARTQTKTAALADAGISTSTANEYEQLAGSREEQAVGACKAGAEAYFAETKAVGVVPTLAGLKAAVREAVVATLGPPPAKTPRGPGITPEYRTWHQWVVAVDHIADADCDLSDVASYRPHYIDKHGNTSTMKTGGIGRRGRGKANGVSAPVSVSVSVSDDHTIHNDPRQLDIKDQPGWKEPTTPAVFDDAAASIRLHINDLVTRMVDPKWPSPEVAMKAWMKGRGMQRS